PLSPGEALPLPTSKDLYTSCNAGNWRPFPAFLLRRSNLKRRVSIPLHLVLSSFFSPKETVVLCLTTLHMEVLSEFRGDLLNLRAIVCPEKNLIEKWAHRYGCGFLRGRHPRRWRDRGVGRERSQRYCR